MLVTTPCPEATVLRRLLLGELTPSELEPLSEHVLHCDRCAGDLNGLRADDPLLQTLRGADTTLPLPPEVDSFIKRLDRWLASVADGASGATLSEPPPAGPKTLAPSEAAVVVSFGFLAPPQSADELGRLGCYRVLKLLGQGGMGAVFLAEDVQLERPVALKVMLPEVAAKPEARQRFLREAKATAKLKDDHVVTIHQVGEDRGVPFLAMEHLQGESLESWMRKGKQLSAAQILRVARDITRGLAAAHAKGLIHRDIKPGNLWLEAPQGRIKVLDFGLARGGVDDLHLTQTGAILGTPAYMAPEQAQGEPVDARSDLFSLGCVLYRLCTGQTPFQGPTVMSVLTALATKEPTSVREMNPQIPEALAGLVMRLLAKRREDRPASAQAVLQELQAIERQPAEQSQTFVQPPEPQPASQTSAKEPAVSPRRPRRALLVATALLGVVGVTALGAILIRITNKDGKQTEINAPEGSKVTVNEKGEVDVKLPGAGEKAVPAVQAAASPLDKLDPARIPATERFDWQPKELVAVLGEHRQRHFGDAQAVAVSADGKRVATSGTDGMVRFWDPTTCAEQGSFRVASPGNYVTALAFSPDAKRLAFSLYDGIGFCDLSGAAPVREKLELPCEGSYRLLFTPDGKRLIAYDRGGTLQIWNVTGATAALWLKRKVFPGGVSLGVSVDRRIIAFCSAEKAVTLLDISGAEAKEIAVVPQPAAVGNLALSPDGKRLAVGLSGNKVHLWDVRGKAPVSRGAIESGEAHVMRFSPDGKRLAVTYGAIRLWNVEGLDPVGGEWFSMDLGAGTIRGLVFTPDGRTLVATHADSTVRFWNLSGDKPQERSALEPSNYLIGTTAPVGKIPLVFNKDSKRLATMHYGFTRWWDLNGTAPVQLGSMPGRIPYAVSPNGKTLLLGWQFFWCDLTADVPREGESFEWGALPGPTVIRLLPDDRTLVFGTESGEVRIVEQTAKSLVERGRFQAGEGSVHLLEVSPDGRMLATEVAGKVKLWDLTGQKWTLRETMQLPGQAILHMTFSPDSRMLAVSVDATTIVWDVQKRPAKQLAKWERYWEEGRSLALAFSPDSRTLASATDRGKLILRDPETGTIRKEWQLPGPIYWVSYAPDGRHLLTINGNGTGYILRLTTADGKPYAPAPRPPGP